MLTTAEIAWGAGLVEGEGFIGFCGSNRGDAGNTCPLLAVGMTDKDVIEKFTKLFRPSRSKTNILRAEGRQINYKPSYHIRISGRHAVGLLMTLYSFMGARRKERIREVLKVWRATKLYRDPIRGCFRSNRSSPEGV